MEKSEFRVLIKHYYLRGKTAKQTKEKLDKYYGPQAPSYATVKKWMQTFESARIKKIVARTTGHSLDETATEKIKEIQEIIIEDNGLKIHEIAKIVEMPAENVLKIIQEQLNMRKLFSRWVPRELTMDQKKERVQISEKIISMYFDNPEKFLRQYVTVAYMWIYYQNSTGQEPKEEATASKQFKMLPNIAGKVLLTIAWSMSGLIMIDFRDEEEYSANDYYFSVLELLSASIKLKSPILAREKVLLHHNNIAIYEAAEAAKDLTTVNFEVLPQPIFGPDLTPFDFQLYPDLKEVLLANKFCSSSDVENKLTCYFTSLKSEYYKIGIDLLPSRWSKCIKFHGNFLEE